MRLARTKCKPIWVCTSFLCDRFLEADTSFRFVAPGSDDCVAIGGRFYFCNYLDVLGILGDYSIQERRYVP